MNPRLERLGVARVSFYVAAVFVVASVFLFQRYMYRLGASYASPLVQNLTSLQEKQLEAFVEMNRLLTTLGTTLLGAMGFLLVGRRVRLTRGELLVALASALCVALSLYFGYIAYQAVIWMLQNAFFDLGNPQVLWTLYAHFYSFLVGAFLFVDLAIHSFNKEQT